MNIYKIFHHVVNIKIIKIFYVLFSPSLQNLMYILHWEPHHFRWAHFKCSVAIRGSGLLYWTAASFKITSVRLMSTYTEGSWLGKNRQNQRILSASPQLYLRTLKFTVSLNLSVGGYFPNLSLFRGKKYFWS